MTRRRPSYCAARSVGIVSFVLCFAGVSQRSGRAGRGENPAVPRPPSLARPPASPEVRPPPRYPAPSQLPVAVRSWLRLSLAATPLCPAARRALASASRQCSHEGVFPTALGGMTPHRESLRVSRKNSRPTTHPSEVCGEWSLATHDSRGSDQGASLRYVRLLSIFTQTLRLTLPKLCSQRIPETAETRPLAAAAVSSGRISRGECIDGLRHRKNERLDPVGRISKELDENQFQIRPRR